MFDSFGAVSWMLPVGRSNLMGAALFIHLEQDIPDFDPFVNGKAVARETEAIERALKTLGNDSLFDFFSVSADEAALMFDDVDDDFVPEIPDDAWLAATDGLPLFTSLVEYVRNNPSEFADSESLAEDLADFVRVLNTAAEHNVRWRLCPDV